MSVLAAVGWYDQNLTLIHTILIFGLLAISVQLAMRCGLFSLASIGFWGIGAYTVALLVKDHDVPHPLALLAATALGLAGGAVLALLLVRLRAIFLGMATIAFNLVVVVAALAMDSVTGGAGGLYGIPPRGGTVTMLVVLAIVCAAVAWSERGSLGRSLEALRIDEQLAESLGIRLATHRVAAFAASAAIGAVSGGLYALSFFSFAPDQFGFSLVVLALTIVIVGGSRSWVGALVGAVIVQWLPHAIASFDEWRTVMHGILLILVVNFAPDGVIGIPRRVAHWLRQRSSSRGPGATSPTHAELQAARAADGDR